MSQDESTYADYRKTSGMRNAGESRVEVGKKSRSSQMTSLVQPKDRNRQFALALAGVGVVALLSAVLLQPFRELLLVLGTIGIYGAALAYLLPEEDEIRSDVATSVYTTQNRDRAELIRELGLSEASVYIPTDDGARLFVPRNLSNELPDTTDVKSQRLLRDRDGVYGASFRPSGDWLYDSVQRVDGKLIFALDSPDRLLELLGDILVHELGLVDEIETEVATTNDYATVVGYNCRYDSIQFDHPVTSFIGVGLAAGLGHPVVVEHHAVADDAKAFEAMFCWEL
jgi:hypothetical protein